MTSKTTATVTPAITHLLQIMSDGRETIRRRLDAAQNLLAFESPEQVVERTKKFLVAVLENREKRTTEHRLLAAQLLRKVEAKKITQRTVGPAESAEWRETMRRLRIAKRREKLIALGLWPSPANWDDDLLAPEPQTDAVVTGITPTGQ